MQMVKTCMLCGVSKPRSEYSHRNWRRNGKCSRCGAAVARLNAIAPVLRASFQRCTFDGSHVTPLLASFYATNRRHDFIQLLKEDKEWPTFSYDTLDAASEFLASISASVLANRGVYTVYIYQTWLTRLVMYHELRHVLWTTKSCKPMRS